MFDTHCHVFFNTFDEDRAAVLQRAFEGGVTHMVQVNCDEQGQQTLLEDVRGATGPVKHYGTIGVHPTEYSTDTSWSEEEYQRLWAFFEEMYATYTKEVVAVGETGLDYFHPHSKTAQAGAFRMQLEFGRAHDLPVILHIRDAYADAIDLLQDYQDVTVIFHCFSGTSEDVRRIQETLPKAYMAFGGTVTYPKSHELRLAVALVEAHRLLLETDCPFLAPQVHRGKRNEPLFVTETAKVVAMERGASYEELERVTDENAMRVFGMN